MLRLIWQTGEVSNADVELRPISLQQVSKIFPTNQSWLAWSYNFIIISYHADSREQITSKIPIFKCPAWFNPNGSYYWPSYRAQYERTVAEDFKGEGDEK